MKKKRITYGVNGMMEYQAVIKVGKKNVNILFSDGSVSAMGTTPASFTTDNIIIQNAIEASNDFKRGLISVVRTINLDEELHVLRNNSNTDYSPRTYPTIQSVQGENSVSGEISINQTDEGNTDVSEKSKDTVTLTKVEFACNDDAKDYLEQKLGYIRYKLRNREDIINAGKSHGIDIIFS